MNEEATQTTGTEVTALLTEKEIMMLFEQKTKEILFEFEDEMLALEEEIKRAQEHDGRK